MTALLTVRALSRRFGGLLAVNCVDMDVELGSIHGVIGPNGAGKTTLLNLISGHLPASSGVVHFENIDVTRWPAERRARAGMRRTFQNLKLFPEMTVLDNVKVGMHGQTRCELWQALLRTSVQQAEELSIARTARDTLEFAGLVHVANMPAGTLPYGTQRLVEIARACVAKPRLLLLDEPAAGLSRIECRRLVEVIRTLRDSGITVVLIEHHMDVVMPTCDRITVLNYGQKLAGGTPAEVRQHPDVIKAYLGGGITRVTKPKRNEGLEAAHAAS